jgi:hypothetical protein
MVFFKFDERTYIKQSTLKFKHQLLRYHRVTYILIVFFLDNWNFGIFDTRNFKF